MVSASIFFRSPRKDVDSSESESKKVADKKEDSSDSEPEDEESQMMKQMMGFSKFDTTKVNLFCGPALRLQQSFL